MFLDGFSYKIRGVDINVLKRDGALRHVILQCVCITNFLWLLMGFDSGVGQIEFPVVMLPNLLKGEINFAEWLGLYNWAYGKTMHFSAFVIYGLLFYGISSYLDRQLELKSSLNTVNSFGITFLNIAIFEYFWIYSFAFFQNQWWVAKWVWPQIRILLQNVMLTVCGIGSIFLFSRAFNFKMKKSFIAILIITALSALFWINYPWYVERFSVYIEGYGVWTNTNKFPQTLYTIDLDLVDTLNAGTWFYHQNDLIHLTNTVVKILFALCSYFFTTCWSHKIETTP